MKPIKPKYECLDSISNMTPVHQNRLQSFNEIRSRKTVKTKARYICRKIIENEMVRRISTTKWRKKTVTYSIQKKGLQKVTDEGGFGNRC